MLKCQEIESKDAWDSFITSRSNHTFLHSWAWGEFNAAMGDNVWRVGVYDNNELVAAALAVKVHAKRGNFLFVPHGPIFAKGENWSNHKSQITNHKQAPNSKFQILNSFLPELKKIAEHEKVTFVRISPLLTDNTGNRALFKDLGFRPAPIHMHAEITWTLDLEPSEAELLMGMRKTTRNLIRRAIKEGVQIKTGNTEEGIEVFNALYQETASRHTFTPFALTYIKNQVRIFAHDNSIQIFTAWYNNECLASAIVVFYGKSAYYHHGASKPSKIPAAYLLQWEAMREAKRRGHQFYNFWGIVPAGATSNSQQPTANKHPWSGITLFKTGFGGFQTNYVHAQDLPLSPLYWVNWTIETIRKKRRNL